MADHKNSHSAKKHIKLEEYLAIKQSDIRKHDFKIILKGTKKLICKEKILEYIINEEIESKKQPSLFNGTLCLDSTFTSDYSYVDSIKESLPNKILITISGNLKEKRGRITLIEFKINSEILDKKGKNVSLTSDIVKCTRDNLIETLTKIILKLSFKIKEEDDNIIFQGNVIGQINENNYISKSLIRFKSKINIEKKDKFYILRSTNLNGMLDLLKSDDDKYLKMLPDSLKFDINGLIYDDDHIEGNTSINDDKDLFNINIRLKGTINDLLIAKINFHVDFIPKDNQGFICAFSGDSTGDILGRKKFEEIQQTYRNRIPKYFASFYEYSSNKRNNSTFATENKFLIKEERVSNNFRTQRPNNSENNKFNNELFNNEKDKLSNKDKEEERKKLDFNEDKVIVENNQNLVKKEESNKKLVYTYSFDKDKKEEIKNQDAPEGVSINISSNDNPNNKDLQENQNVISTNIDNKQIVTTTVKQESSTIIITSSINNNNDGFINKPKEPEFIDKPKEPEFINKPIEDNNLTNIQNNQIKDNNSQLEKNNNISNVSISIAQKVNTDENNNTNLQVSSGEPKIINENITNNKDLISNNRYNETSNIQIIENKPDEKKQEVPATNESIKVSSSIQDNTQTNFQQDKVLVSSNAINNQSLNEITINTQNNNINLESSNRKFVNTNFNNTTPGYCSSFAYNNNNQNMDSGYVSQNFANNAPFNNVNQSSQIVLNNSYSLLNSNKINPYQNYQYMNNINAMPFQNNNMMISQPQNNNMIFSQPQLNNDSKIIETGYVSTYNNNNNPYQDQGYSSYNNMVHDQGYTSVSINNRNFNNQNNFANQGGATFPNNQGCFYNGSFGENINNNNSNLAFQNQNNNNFGSMTSNNQMGGFGFNYTNNNINSYPFRTSGLNNSQYMESNKNFVMNQFQNNVVVQNNDMKQPINSINDVQSSKIENIQNSQNLKNVQEPVNQNIEQNPSNLPKSEIKEVKKDGIKEVKKDEIKDDKKDEIKEDKKDGIKEDKKDGIKEDKKDEIKDDKKDGIKDDKKDEVKEDKKDEIKEEIIEEVIEENIVEEKDINKIKINQNEESNFIKKTENNIVNTDSVDVTMNKKENLNLPNQEPTKNKEEGFVNTPLGDNNNNQQNTISVGIEKSDNSLTNSNKFGPSLAANPGPSLAENTNEHPYLSKFGPNIAKFGTSLVESKTINQNPPKEGGFVNASITNENISAVPSNNNDVNLTNQDKKLDIKNPNNYPETIYLDKNDPKLKNEFNQNNDNKNNLVYESNIKIGESNVISNTISINESNMLFKENQHEIKNEITNVKESTNINNTTSEIKPEASEIKNNNINVPPSNNQSEEAKNLIKDQKINENPPSTNNKIITFIKEKFENDKITYKLEKFEGENDDELKKMMNKLINKDIEFKDLLKDDINLFPDNLKFNVINSRIETSTFDIDCVLISENSNNSGFMTIQGNIQNVIFGKIVTNIILNNHNFKTESSLFIN